jgi:DNA repair exonuclease SbcCD nuclease subunit
MGNTVIIGDLHFGIHLSDERFLDYQIEEWKKFIDYCETNDVSQLIILGDFFDNRNYLSVKMIDIVKKQIIKHDMDIVLLVGNHDTLYKNTNAVSSPRLIFGLHDNIKVIDKVQELYIDDVKCLMLPWINKENYSKSMAAIKKTDADFCFGHLELAGFEMTSGIKCINGLNAALFKKFKAVLTGHFHLVQKVGNINYLGSFYQTTWTDSGDQKNIYVVEDGFADIKSVPMARSIFKKIYLTKDSKISKEHIEYATDSYVKIYLSYKMTAKEEKLLSNLSECAIKCDVIDLRLLLEEDDSDVANEDFMEIFNGFMELQEELDPDLKAGVIKLIKTTYSEALEK